MSRKKSDFKAPSDQDKRIFNTRGFREKLNNWIDEAVEVITSEDRYRPILISGPTGTGKTDVKNTIRLKTFTSDKKIEEANCAAISPNLAESELYGHKKGAFTGAINNKKGYLGMGLDLLILEELGTLPKFIQAKLLTFIETGQYHSIGIEEPRLSKTRILGVTNVPPDSPKFREDFIFRFHVITIPPLHMRRNEIPYLLKCFLPDIRFCKFEMLRLMCYHWPGNMREMDQFTYMVNKYKHYWIKDGVQIRFDILEWFNNRFCFGFDIDDWGPTTPGIPHMMGLEHFRQSFEFFGELWRKVGNEVSRFALVGDDVGSPLESNKVSDQTEDDEIFSDDELQLYEWAKEWHRWCHIVHQDKYANRDLWECLIKGERTLTRDPVRGCRGRRKIAEGGGRKVRHQLDD